MIFAQFLQNHQPDTSCIKDHSKNSHEKHYKVKAKNVTSKIQFDFIKGMGTSEAFVVMRM